MTHIDTMKQALKFIEATNKSSSFWLVPDSNLNKTVTALRLAIEQAQKQEPVAWRTFDGEGGYEYRTYEGNEDYIYQYVKRNGGKYAHWVEPLFDAPPQRQREGCAECGITSSDDSMYALYCVQCMEGVFKREPLTDGKIIEAFNEACREHFQGLDRVRHFVRAIERAHGIGGDK